MNKLLKVLVLLAVPVLLEAQSASSIRNSLPPGSQTVPFFTKTNYTTATGDTTGYISIRDYDEVSVLAFATDSVEQLVTVDGKNSILKSSGADTILATYSDSLVGVSNTLNVKKFYIRGVAGERFIGCDLIRFRITGEVGAGQNGTSTGRKMVWYLFLKKQSVAR